MEEERGEWEIVEEEEGGGGEGKMSLVLNKGWGVGKKIMITGVVISSAPIVVPPLVVFSTLGFAFAVPFGMLFATYACTDKLMSKLFSTPPSEDEGSEEQMGREEGEVGYVDRERTEPVDDANIGEENEQIVEEAKVGEKPKEEAREIEEVEKPAAEKKNETKKEEVPVEEAKQVNEEKGKSSEVHIGEQEKKPSENVQIVEGNKEQENGVVRVEEDRPMEEKRSMPEKSENGEIIGDKNVDDKEAKVASPAHSTADNASDASQGSTGREVQGSAGSKNDRRTRKTKTAAAVSTKEAYSEEKKIWEQIDALRKILGYKVAPQVNSMEEVKALYVFTGVEPPRAFKAPSDLADVGDKLQLLMSIVGVK